MLLLITLTTATLYAIMYLPRQHCRLTIFMELVELKIVSDDVQHLEDVQLDTILMES